jgi:hypothetical protein
MIQVHPDSNIAKILGGQTKGYHDWYVRHILSMRSNFIIKK